MHTPRIVFMGSPDFDLPTLRSLAAHYPVVGVISQPDRAAGRGRALTPPPVKSLALELDLPIIQPNRLREPAALEQLRAWAPDLIVVAAFGQILRADVLNLPRFGCINVHASLLPRWRGAAPIQACLLHGDAETGVTIMCMDPGIDTGPTLAQRVVPITPADTAVSLSERLANTGAALLLDTLPAYLRGELTAQPQPEDGATYARMLKKEDGLLDFTRPAVELERQVRAYFPWPGAYTAHLGQPLKVLRAHTASGGDGAPGQALVYQGLPAVAAGGGFLVFDEVQPAGKKAMPGAAFLAGVRSWAHTQLGETP